LSARPGAAARLVAILALASTAGCREAPLPAEVQDRGPLPDHTLARLTFSDRSDRSPAWSPGGDSIYYVADDYEASGVARLVAIPADGMGPARPLLQGLPTGLRPLAPAREPGSEVIAYLDPYHVVTQDRCRVIRATMSCSVGTHQRVEPFAVELRLRLRRPASTAPVAGEPWHRLPADGYVVDSTYRLHPGVWQTELFTRHPFQQAFAEGNVPFRPSWAPGGGRLVYSDGRSLRVWRTAEAHSAPVPGTEHGAWPAWSPDGQWIAYTRLVPGDTTANRCIGFTLGPDCAVEQHVIATAERLLVLTRPDGAEERVLGTGIEPAWSPDGRHLYYVDGDRLWRLQVAPATGTPAALPGSGGREPAVSPDGRSVAFTAARPNGIRDVWLLRLP
jgi:hypothetical protein